MAIDRKGAGRRAKAIRERYGWSLRKLAKVAEINPGTLKHIEKGGPEGRPATEAQVTKLADALRVTEAELLGLSE